ncbi:hypothetical protein [Kibdelosporangium phytohabitans]|uniref:Uncharacterized protein n=1 Tax=Kibdelosporangium phytohabitans TaxID=860235 RepID=A0A0N7F4B8_9PSEU|nr:hypothetical protein [Kibdelosporangium phytohabitans]ALG10991.1 hypothetical protein AOZ06_32550 [Kibdelosporangium phytohabitans]MBE1462204.1 hypothetical protein [Kibdelosporangium phytohabitans]
MTVQGQIEHGLVEAKYGYWGFSPASNPFGGYAAYGAPPLGMDPGGYPSDVEGTTLDYGFGDCRPAPHRCRGRRRRDTARGFPRVAVRQGRGAGQLGQAAPGLSGRVRRGRFKDSVAVRSGKVADRYLALDRVMVLGAIGNSLRHGLLRTAFTRGEADREVRPLLAIEEFGFREGKE